MCCRSGSRHLFLPGTPILKHASSSLPGREVDFLKPALVGFSLSGRLGAVVPDQSPISCKSKSVFVIRVEKQVSVFPILKATIEFH